jgi:hypothetical protein
MIPREIPETVMHTASIPYPASNRPEVPQMTINMILLVVAFACFVVATFNPPFPRINIVALGLAFGTLSFLIH